MRCVTTRSLLPLLPGWRSCCRFPSWGVGPSGEGSRSSVDPTRRSPCTSTPLPLASTPSLLKTPGGWEWRVGVHAGGVVCRSHACVPNCMSASGFPACRYSPLFSIGRLLVNGAHLLLIGRVRLSIWAGVHAVASHCVTLRQSRTGCWVLCFVALFRFQLRRPVELCRRAWVTVSYIYTCKTNDSDQVSPQERRPSLVSSGPRVLHVPLAII
jgi:hypothetical protein